MLLAFALVGATSDVAHAHGGEDHSEPAAAPASSGSQRTTFGQTSQFEVLIRLDPAHAGDLRVFVADWATNAPIAGAEVVLEVQATPVVKVIAEPAGTPGSYHAITRLAAGVYPIIATITAGDRLDLVEIAPLDFGPGASTVAPSHPSAGLPWRALGLGAGGLAALVVLAVAGVRYARRRREVRRVIPIAALVLAVSMPLLARGHGGEDHDEPKQAAAPTGRAGVTTIAKESQFLLGVLTRVTVAREVSARIETVGRVVPRLDGHAMIAAAQPGRVVAPPGQPLPFLGDRVRKGQALLILEQTPAAAEAGDLRARSLAATTAVAQAKARQAQAARELARSRALVGIVSQSDLEQAQLALDLADRDVELAQQQSRLFGGDALRRLTVTAPIDGVIAEAEVALGEQVAADQKLYTIVEPSRLWVEADVLERDLPRLEQSGTADLRLDGRPNTFPARLFRLGQLVDPSTRTIKAIFEVDNAAGAFRPGMFATVAIGAGPPRTALVVPDAAVIEEGGRRFVFVHVTPEEFVRREVVLGARDRDDWAVAAGLDRGERVVVQGTYQVRTTR